ncbi:hypothetical protein Tcan_05116 [Toxocara canis]|uniref:Uncharacterized protein n=1 Tax=Toxocara canis TaxID=6265 RepID=A0A0B2VPT5_TOXCA|nr:hypothetical protein Tcan_05116 [Toxocara canis]
MLEIIWKLARFNSVENNKPNQVSLAEQSNDIEDELFRSSSSSIEHADSEYESICERSQISSEMSIERDDDPYSEWMNLFESDGFRRVVHEQYRGSDVFALESGDITVRSLCLCPQSALIVKTDRCYYWSDYGSAVLKVDRYLCHNRLIDGDL